VIAIGSLGVVGMGGWDRVEEPMLARLTDEERERLATAPPGAGFEIIWPAYFSSRDATPPFPGIRSDPEVLHAVYGWLEQHTAEPGIVDALRRLDRPVLILHGSEDVIPLEPLEETAALIPAAKLTVFQGVGHFPWVERPGCVHAAVVDFLAARSS
jgi:pimeloyl-ACP methyl ester carboxylesterase